MTATTGDSQPAPAPPFDPAAGFLDVPSLLHRSQAVQQGPWLWYAAGAFLLLVLLSTWASSRSSLSMQRGLHLLSAMAMIGVIGGMGLLSAYMARRQKAERQQLEAAEELVTLRRWPQAAVVLQDLLSGPMRSPHHRVQGLIYLSAVLARYHRFEDAIAVQNHLLQTVELDDSTGHAVRLGRAMAMLREDHLHDADRAISELRRTPQGPQSGGLALIEIYRDVKTGHPEEALATFEQRLPSIRQQLGHRVADAWAMASKAYDLLGRDAEAEAAWRNATLLAPVSELQRRYPEVEAVAEKYEPTPAPAAGEAGGEGSGFRVQGSVGSCELRGVSCENPQLATHNPQLSLATGNWQLTTPSATIARFRRDLAISSLLKGLFIGSALACIPLLGLGIDATVGLVGLGSLWLVLSYRSLKGSRVAAASPSLIATGQFEEAEARIQEALRSFSLFRAVKLLSLHHLAVLRHAQRRWDESAVMCKALLGQRLGTLQDLRKPSRLILADAMLEMGDLREAWEAMSGLYRERLGLGEAMNLLAVQLDYLSRIGAWERMFEAVTTKVQLAEVMPAAASARAQSLLALAALKLGRQDWCRWLARRAELLADVGELAAARPLLCELWRK